MVIYLHTNITTSNGKIGHSHELVVFPTVHLAMFPTVHLAMFPAVHLIYTRWLRSYEW
jgi:hypothetical protein